ncbi:MAG: M28 family metallopeptidase [Gammaproteobacteria bacterium]
MRNWKVMTLFTTAVLTLTLATIPVSLLADDDDDDDDGDDIGEISEELQEAVRVGKVRTHQAAFQTFADATDGTRFSGFDGYNLSADYVAGLLEDAGYDVTRQSFELMSTRKLGPSNLEQLTPAGVIYEEDVDFNVMSETDPGDVSGPATAVDLDLGPAGDGLGNSSTSGCEAADFTGFPGGNIALMQRGACSFQQKAENAAGAGAVGAIIFNQGNTEDRRGLINGTLSADYSGGIPVFFATFDRGLEWAGTAGLALGQFANVFRGIVTTSNVIADSRTGDPNNIVVSGAHLDSVDEGPGIQDNGSGSAAILELALQLADEFEVNERDDDDDDDDNGLRNRVRFAWWGAEESGLVGSDFYVLGLSDEERNKIRMYLNYDMVGSPNFARFIYDGDGSGFGLAGPAGSAAIEALFEDYFARQRLPTEPTEISFRSDYAAFFDAGIPFGGLFTGAEGIKTEEQVALYGGTPGDQYDPCYHLACDTFDNISLTALRQNSKAAAHALAVYAFSDLDQALADAASMATTLRALSAVSAAGPEQRGGKFLR